MDLRKKREELQQVLQQTAIQLEQVKGAIALCDQLIAEENKTNDVETASNTDGQLPT